MHFCAHGLQLQARTIFRCLSSTSKEIRLNKYLSEIGVCSRRAADKLIQEGRVIVNDKTALLGTKVNVIAASVPRNETYPVAGNAPFSVHLSSRDVITVNGKVVREKVKGHIYLALNKPVGIVCTTDTKREKNNIIDFLKYPSGERLFHVGRLDKPSCGLILLTNDGDIVNKVLRAEHNHEKEYIVKVDRPLTEKMLLGMSSGVPLFDGTVVTNQCRVARISSTAFSITLTQGLNRQIRRMCSYFNYEVISLERIRVMHVRLGSLPVGAYRELTTEEVNELTRPQL